MFTVKGLNGKGNPDFLLLALCVHHLKAKIKRLIFYVDNLRLIFGIK